MTERSEIAQGIQLEAPHLWIPWDMTMAEFIQVFADHTQAAPRLVSPGYYVARCQLLRGLVAQVGRSWFPGISIGCRRLLPPRPRSRQRLRGGSPLVHQGRRPRQCPRPTRRGPNLS